MMKVKMKISGSFRTLEGAQIFARLRSVVSTARKHGCNILQILTASPDQHHPSPRRIAGGLGVTIYKNIRICEYNAQKNIEAREF